MSEIDNIKTSLKKSTTDLERIHSKLDSVDTAKQKTIPRKYDIEVVATGIPKKEESIPEKKTIPEKEPVFTKKEIETQKHKFSPKEREEEINGFLKKTLKTQKLKRKEKNMIKNAEYDAVGGKLREITIGLAVVGFILIVVLKSYLPTDVLFALLIIIGATSFLPIGMIMGWLVFDPVMRCKVLRKVSRRNYGVIQFVGQGGKMFPKIKNFDQSLIWRNNECWVLAESRVYQQTNDGNAINDGKTIDAKNIVTYVDTVPVLFLDTHSMAPMRLSSEGDTSVYPVEIGSSLKAWVDNQRAKMMAIKKMEDTMMLIIIGSCIGAVVVSLITMTRVEEMNETIGSLREQMQFIIDNINTKVP